MWESLDRVIDWDSVDAAVTVLVAWTERAVAVLARPVAMIVHVFEWIEVGVGVAIGLWWLGRLAGETCSWFLATYR